MYRFEVMGNSFYFLFNGYKCLPRAFSFLHGTPSMDSWTREHSKPICQTSHKSLKFIDSDFLWGNKRMVQAHIYYSPISILWGNNFSNQWWHGRFCFFEFYLSNPVHSIFLVSSVLLVQPSLIFCKTQDYRNPFF